MDVDDLEYMLDELEEEWEDGDKRFVWIILYCLFRGTRKAMAEN